MQFNSETNGLDLYTDARFLLGIETGDGGATPDTTTMPIKTFTRNANMALDRCTMLALKCDGIWQFDDSNQTGELLDVSSNLVSGTQKYAMSVTWLKIGKVRTKDAAGNWITLIKRDRRQFSDAQLTAPTGTPTFYDIMGGYIYLYCAPNYSSTGGLEIQFERGPSYFVYTDTTKTPGFASPFHRLVSLMAAQDFADANDMDARSNKIAIRLGTPPDLENREPGSGMLKEFCDYYSARDEDGAPNLSVAREDYGQGALSSDNFPNGSINRPNGW